MANAVAFTIFANDQATMALAKVGSGVTRLKADAGGLASMFGRTGTEGVGKFQNALANLALTQTGLTGNTGRLIESLSLMGLGGGLVTAIAGGIALIGSAWRALTRDSAEAEERTKRVTSALRAQTEAAREASLAGKQEAFAIAQKNVREFLDSNAPAYLRGQENALRSYLSLKGKLQEYINLLDDAATAQQNMFNAGSLPREMTISAGGRGTGQASRPLQEPGRVDVFGILASMRPEGGRPERPRGFTVPTIELIDPRSIRIPEPQSLLDGIGYYKWVDDMGTAISESFSATVGDSISNAFASAFSGEGVGGAIAAFGKTMLAGIGSIFSMMGDQYLKFGTSMKALAPLLSNPFTAGAAGIAIGLLLKALGGALGGIARGGSGGSFSSGGFSSAPRSFAYQPGGDYFNKNGRGSTVINIHGGPVIDLRDHATRDQLATAGIELRHGTRQDVQVNHVRRS